MQQALNKPALRKQLRTLLSGLSDIDRHRKSLAATALLTASQEFASAQVVMLYLSMPQEIDTSAVALRCWQENKTVVVPKVHWEQRRMMPVEIHSLKDEMEVVGPGVLEPVKGTPIPLNLIDLVIVPGLGFTADGYRIGRGMGFYDRFLAQTEFIGLSCGFAFEEQIVEKLPLLDHDMPLSMLVTDREIRRFATNCIPQK